MPLIEFKSLFLKTPIYEKFIVEDSDLQDIFNLFHYVAKLDFYCPY